MEAYDKYDHGGLLNNRYAKVNDLSQGSYGLVSLAKDVTCNNALVAVKYIFPVDYKRKKQYSEFSNTTGRATSSPAKLSSNSPSSDSKNKAMISALCEESSKEILIHKILGEHPNIPKLIDHFDSCLVLEYCSKGDLYEAMQNDVGPTTSQDIKDVFAQILSAISYCHSKSVFHRDLKPENILIAQDWSIKICDWGLATTQQIITNPREFDIGSERYMAPELFDTELRSYDASKVDLWSLGVILLTLVFHKNPFQIANYTDKRFLQFSANREALFDFFSSMTGEMFSALRFCLTMDPSNRDLEKFRNELQILKYFTIDEEYWAMHSEEEDEMVADDNGYEEEEEDDDDEDDEDEDGDITLPETTVQSEDTYLFGSMPAEITVHSPKLIPHRPDTQIKIITPEELPHNRYISIDETLESDMTLVMGGTMSNREDLDTVPYNRRAEALLSPTTNTKPIPIGGAQHIRNTRKPFGVASYNKNGACPALQKYQNSFNGYSNSHGYKFRREDFFTPRSVLSHYMDKYGEQKERGPHEKKKKVWNSGRKKQSWKKRGNAYQSSQNGASHSHANEKQANGNHQGWLRRQPRPSTANPPNIFHSSVSPTNYVPLANGAVPHAGLSVGRSTGKYVPPFLRSPQLLQKSVAVDAVTEEIDNLALTDGEVFVLEDDYHEDDTVSGEQLQTFPKNGNSVLFRDLSGDSFHNRSAETRRRSMSRVDNNIPFNSGKYVPPFRRGSMGILNEKRRLFVSNDLPFQGFLQGLLDEEALRNIPAENWLFKKDWRG